MSTLDSTLDLSREMGQSADDLGEGASVLDSTVDPLLALSEAGLLSHLDVQLARNLDRLSQTPSALVSLAVALVSRAVSSGHVCLELQSIASRAIVDMEGSPIEFPVADSNSSQAACWPDLESWLSELSSHPLFSDGSTVTPLVMDAHQRLYLYRYWRDEQSLIEEMRARLGPADQPVNQELLRAGLERLFAFTSSHEVAPPLPVKRRRRRPRVSPGQLELFDLNQESSKPAATWAQPSCGPAGAPQSALGPPDPRSDQRLAAITVLDRRLAVIVGGPGTGKTTTVTRILLLLQEQRLAAGQPALRIVLTAPTGKAAARLMESLESTKKSLSAMPTLLATIPDEALTIHRCLGFNPSTRVRFSFDQDNPLALDVLVVDEASMVDLPLMAQLFRAVPPEARIILLGDQDQLASVEVGALLGDVCLAGERRPGPSVARRKQIEQLLGDRCLDQPEAGLEDGLQDSIVQLRHNWRFRADGGIGSLAELINLGQADQVMDLLKRHAAGRLAGPQQSPLSYSDPTEDAKFEAHVGRLAENGYRQYLETVDPQESLRLFDHFRLLCAHRSGPRGVEAINRSVEQHLKERGLISATNARWYAHRPIMITRNDYQMGLFNGDVGIILAEPTDPTSLRAWFKSPGGNLRSLLPARLPAHETAFALTVHKSQGSEFDHIALILPERSSRVMTRELLYTAVTRARERVDVIGPELVLREGIGRRIQRSSGLREALWGF